MLHQNDDYTKEELQHLEQLLLSYDEASLLLAIELIRNQGFHQQLERPLALLHFIEPNYLSEAGHKAVKKLYKSRIDSLGRMRLIKELGLFKNFRDYIFEKLDATEVEKQISYLENLYPPYLENRPHLLPIFSNLGLTLSQENLFELAESLYLMAIRWGSQDEDTYFNLALLYQNEFEQLENAAKYYKQALALDPQDYVAHNNIGQVYESMKKYELAAQHLEMALLIRPNYIHSIVNLAYIRWRHQPHYEEAQQLYEQALQIDPYETYALCNYAALLVKHHEGQLERAEQMLREALSIDESDDYAWKVLAQVMLKKDPPDKEKALEYYEKAHLYDPEDKETIAELNKVKAALKDG